MQVIIYPIAIIHHYLKFSDSLMQVTEPGYKTSQPEVTFEIKLSEQQTVTTLTIH